MSRYFVKKVGPVVILSSHKGDFWSSISWEPGVPVVGG